MNALEAYRSKSSALQRINQHRNTVRRVVDVGEQSVGAVVAGALDAKLPAFNGAPPSLLLGVATTAAGVAMAQRDLVALGTGMLLPHAYDLGFNLAGNV